ncbi:bifunctional adenosylcobinamide kinase/adenosylcobinamide-phosphate guanylyltransferase [Anaerocolumna sp. AGMB13025]|uniref:bifunctional adenosylcobinamide kinase/adenosylcobinamide-phosphate guanylyltransferase n=1 Tax=Anaerocolumna sp. AGMB13025 TaxID=3039116 RepID=UPI00241CB2BE|nr:bifunctional adenosylcobinamide kinase/adenosylcobinamide-phosphate guanylyltransferase [Anaerocolumna sp. AGMB13025]WFR56094.1 bifunctional adenosylcobinamide kinase/adenosylcobinamide-phosphate guanylyltransferase [Anaerocolumna sp. AGMB13025]
MELYIGGMSQGKLNFVCREKGLAKDSREICDGKDCSMEEILTKPVINHLHVFIKRLLETAQENSDLPDVDLSAYPHLKSGNFTEPHHRLAAVMEELIAGNPSAVIICNELGYGIVPMDKADRVYRETVGRCLCRLAAYSERVVRVVCGLGMTIK